MSECFLENNNLKNQKKVAPLKNIKDVRYQQHIERRKNMKHIIDNTAPVSSIDQFLRSNRIGSDKERFKLLIKQNIELVKRINHIDRTKGDTCNYNPNGCYRTTKNGAALNKLIEIELYNEMYAKNILCVKNEVETRKKLSEFWNFMLKMIKQRSKYPIILPDLLQLDDLDCGESNKNRPLVYLDLGVRNGRPLGRMVILLYVDLAPLTVKNFIDLLENHRNRKKKKKQSVETHNVIEDNNLCLIGTIFHRIFPSVFIEGGNLNFDQKAKNFSGIPPYPPESFTLSHACKGTLAMAPDINGNVNSEFTISLKSLNVLNGKRCAFGRIKKGLNILDVIECYGTKNGKPKKEIEITNCGILKLNL